VIHATPPGPPPGYSYYAHPTFANELENEFNITQDKVIFSNMKCHRAHIHTHPRHVCTTDYYDRKTGERRTYRIVVSVDGWVMSAKRLS
jgi:hypothetical protein